MRWPQSVQLIVWMRKLISVVAGLVWATASAAQISLQVEPSIVSGLAVGDRFDIQLNTANDPQIPLDLRIIPRGEGFLTSPPLVRVRVVQGDCMLNSGPFLPIELHLTEIVLSFQTPSTASECVITYELIRPLPGNIRELGRYSVVSATDRSNVLAQGNLVVGTPVPALGPASVYVLIFSMLLLARLRIHSRLFSAT